jgi:hypothetical protein
MANYSIPNRFLPGFELIHSLDSSQIEEVIRSLNLINIGDGPNVLADILVENDKIKNVDTNLISRTIFSIINLVQEDDINNIVPELSKSFSLSSQIGNKDNPTELIPRLELIIKSSAKISLSIKALQVRSEYKNVIQDSKIITDIRVIFEDNLYADKKNAIIVHNLKLEYLDDQEPRDLYFAMDKQDLLKLRETIDRALVKEESIRNSKELSYINVNE